jgi:hypothetical protein
MALMTAPKWLHMRCAMVTNPPAMNGWHDRRLGACRITAKPKRVPTKRSYRPKIIENVGITHHCGVRHTPHARSIKINANATGSFDSLMLQGVAPLVPAVERSLGVEISTASCNGRFL